MGLMPDQFWDLTWTEFHIKHDAFVRAEDRMRALVYDLTAGIGFHDKKAKEAIATSARVLRRYAMKSWLVPK
jgi:hypothetical protein